MKKIITVAFVLFLALGFASCKKEYNCHCIITLKDNTSGDTVEQLKDTKITATKGKAEDECDAMDRPSTTANGYTSETKCSIQ